MDHEIELPTGEPGDENGSIQFIGNATVLLRAAGFTLLTDPNFLHAGEHMHVAYGLVRSKRLHDPAVEFEELPSLDLVVVSHLHEDHFDRKVKEKLSRSVRLATTPESARALKRWGFSNVHGLETWQSLSLIRGEARLRVTAMPGRHGPRPIAYVAPDVMGSMLEITTAPDEEPYRIYVSGDTLVYEDLHEIPKRYPEINCALLHLGGTRMFGILLTMDAKHGIEAIRIVNPGTVIPIHFDDYDVFKSPLVDFLREVERAGLSERVQVLERGESFSFSTRGARKEPWGTWREPVVPLPPP